MTVNELAFACREETARFLRREDSRDAFCLELLRRAIEDRLPAAWDAVFAQYRGMVLAWIRRHPLFPATREDDAYWVNRTFDRFWAAVGPEKFRAFPSMAATLRYLKMCAHSVLHDEVRARGDELPEEALHGVAVRDDSEAAMDQLTASALWETINAALHDDAERHVASLCFVLGLKPREICDRHPDLFPTVGDVYRVKRNLLDRLRRNPEILTFLG